jgi:glycosyltransferase involved in cell wall biosynthesis
MDCSIVVPVFNEAENVASLVEEIDSVLRDLPLKSEILFVNDGSTDETQVRLESLFAGYARLKVLCLRKNFGQTSALVAGFDHSSGDVIIAMDGDGQNDPRDIPRLLEKIREGYDIVSGWRKKRRDRLFSRRIPSMIANRIISISTGIRLHDYGCSLKAFRREVILNTNLYGEMHRFIPAVASWMGVRLAEIEVNHRPRTAGVSKYGLSRTIRVILDLITVKFLLSFSTKPIQIFGLWGMGALVAGGLFFFLVVFQRFFMSVPANRPLFTVAVFLILSGFQFISIGLLAEIQIRMYHESTHKPIYAVKNILRHEPDGAVQPG